MVRCVIQSEKYDHYQISWDLLTLAIVTINHEGEITVVWFVSVVHTPTKYGTSPFFRNNGKKLISTPELK